MSNKVKSDTTTSQIDIQRQAKQVFDKKVDSLNSDSLKRLGEARNKALLQNDQPVWLSKKWLTGAGAGLAFASIMAFLIVPQLNNDKLSPLEDLEMLSAEVDMDLYTHLDFYQWLDESLDDS